MRDCDLPVPPASQALLSAALGGLLCLVTPGCSSATSPSSTDAGGSAMDGAAADSGKTRADAGKAGGDATAMSDTETTSPDTPVPDVECDGGVSPDAGVTSSMVSSNMTLAKFTKECDAKGGILEIQPHCGGSNACRGMSYDSETKILIEHTCRATNSCGGYSCVVCK